MGCYFIVDKNTGRKLRKNCCDVSFTTEKGAKISLTRKLRDNDDGPEFWIVMSQEEYDAAFPVTMVPVTNLMTGKVVMERSDTPRCCSVGSELYWCS